MKDTTAITPEIIREVVVADIIDAKPDRPPRVLSAKPEITEAETLKAMDELLGSSKAEAVKKPTTWTVWVSCYRIGYKALHNRNSMNFLFQPALAYLMPRFDIIKLDDETWVFKPDPKGLRTAAVRGGRGRVTILDDTAPFRSMAVPLVEVDGVYMAHIPVSARQPVELGEAYRKRMATVARRRAEEAEEARKAAERQNRQTAQQARRAREQERETTPTVAGLDQRQAQEKLVQPARLAQAMREFAEPPEVRPVTPPRSDNPIPVAIVDDLKTILRQIQAIEAMTPYRISRVRNEDGSTTLVWKAPNIVA